MSEVAITVENLSKRFVIGEKQQRHTSVRDALAGRVKSLVQFVGNRRNAQETIWALKDVSFQVKQGDIIGVIGNNGAGKSTLLKILAHITEPTFGRATIYGRVGSLLEVGTGFHPELTGRENIYLNGTILGMSKREIRRKFDEIVDFSGVEKFIDTPVKRYSSGMKVRLAFSVAAHLEPEILIIDEVLAVGDIAFQKKCLGKVGSIASGGRTVLFVSHNLAVVREMCPRSIWIERGEVLMDEASDLVVSSYLASNQKGSVGEALFEQSGAAGDEDAVAIKALRLRGQTGEVTSLFNIDECVTVEIEFEVEKLLEGFHLFINVFTHDGVLVFGSASWDTLGLDSQQKLAPRKYVGRCKIPGDLLNRGIYSLSVNGQVPNKARLFNIENALEFTVSEIGGAGGAKSRERPGVVRPRLKWSIDSA